MRWRNWPKKQNGLVSIFVAFRAQKLPKKWFLGSNGHFFMYNTHFQCFHQKQNVVPHLYASFGYLQIIHLGARAKKHQFWAVLMYQLFFFMYDTLFWCLKRSLQPNIYLSTKFQTSKFNGLAVMAFFSDFWGVFGAKWPFFYVQQPFSMPSSEAEYRAPSLCIIWPPPDYISRG